MKKLVLMVVLVCLTVGLSAQKVQQVKKSGSKKMKRNWEAEYYEMEKKYNSTHQAYKTLSAEHEKMRNRNKTLEAEKRNFKSLQDKNAALKKENSALRKENEDLKAKLSSKSKVKKLKKVQQQ